MRDFVRIADAWARDDREVLDTLSAGERRALGLIAIGEGDGLGAADAEFVLGMKASPLFRLSAKLGEHVTRADAPDHTLTFVLSDETVDRAGDIVRQNFELGNYGFAPSSTGGYEPTGKGNPVVLWAHAFSTDMKADLPIGRMAAVRPSVLVGQDGKQIGARTFGDVNFASEHYEFADQVERLARAKFVNAGSIGFRPINTKRDHTPEEHEAAGLGKMGVEFLRSEILEYSLCAVPCNPNALQNSIRAGSIEERDADLLKALGTERDWERFVRRRARAFVDMGRSTPQPTQGAADERASDGLRGMAAAAPASDALAAAIKSLSETVRELASAREDDAASRRMLARSITDLGQRLGAIRAVDAARPVADAALSPVHVAEIQRMLKTIK